MWVIIFVGMFMVVPPRVVVFGIDDTHACRLRFSYLAAFWNSIAACVLRFEYL